MTGRLSNQEFDEAMDAIRKDAPDAQVIQC
jgi:hypothetical protein